MATKPRVQTKSGGARTAPAPLEPYVPGDALPLPEVIEKDSDSVWALWSEAVKGTPDKDTETQPATLLMGLSDLPKDPDA